MKLFFLGAVCLWAGLAQGQTVTQIGAPQVNGLAPLTSAHVFVGNSSNLATDVAMTGDITITNAGVTAIGATKVTNAMLAGAIDLTAKVTGILPTANGGTGIAYFTAAGPTSTRVFTFPDAAATIARTDAGQTFTGAQKISANLLVNSTGTQGVVGLEVISTGFGTGAVAVTDGGTGSNRKVLQMTINAGIAYIDAATVGGGPVALVINPNLGTTTIGGQLLVTAMTQTAVAQSGTVCYNVGTGAITYDATVGCLVSSMRFKHDWAPLVGSLDKVMALEAGTFRYDDPTVAGGGLQLGLNAENMAKIEPTLVGYAPDGQLMGVRYQNTVGLLVGAIQDLQHEIQDLKRNLH